MTSGSKVITNPRTGYTIIISTPAQTMIGRDRVDEFAGMIHKIMTALQIERAYVSKSGAALDVHLIRSNGWRDHMRVRRGGEHE